MSEPVNLRGANIGVGLRHPHYDYFLETPRDVAFLEVHPENYFCGGKNLAILDDIAQNYTLSLHAVGLSLGSANGVDDTHIEQFKQLIQRYNPLFISDHVSWSASGNAHLNDLLPLPYTDESLAVICENISRVQDAFGRKMLIENPSSYCSFTHSTMSEVDFLNDIVTRTGCGLLLDINNIYVQAHNHGKDALSYLNQVNQNAVEEIHLAGHITETLEDTTLLIDTHSQPVCDDVWALYSHAITCFPDAHTLIEWDKDIPDAPILMGEAYKAATMHSEPKSA